MLQPKETMFTKTQISRYMCYLLENFDHVAVALKKNAEPIRPGRFPHDLHPGLSPGRCSLNSRLYQIRAHQLIKWHHGSDINRCRWENRAKWSRLLFSLFLVAGWLIVCKQESCLIPSTALSVIKRKKQPSTFSLWVSLQHSSHVPFCSLLTWQDWHPQEVLLLLIGGWKQKIGFRNSTGRDLNPSKPGHFGSIEMLVFLMDHPQSASGNTRFQRWSPPFAVRWD